MTITQLPIASHATIRQTFPIFVSNLTLGTNYVVEGLINANSQTLELSRYTTGGSTAAAVAMDTAATVVATFTYISQ
jgi:hypothetical protein